MLLLRMVGPRAVMMGAMLSLALRTRGALSALMIHDKP